MKIKNKKLRKLKGIGARKVLEVVRIKHHDILQAKWKDLLLAEQQRWRRLIIAMLNITALFQLVNIVPQGQSLLKGWLRNHKGS